MKINIGLTGAELLTGISSGTLVPFIEAVESPDSPAIDVSDAVKETAKAKKMDKAAETIAAAPEKTEAPKQAKEGLPPWEEEPKPEPVKPKYTIEQLQGAVGSVLQAKGPAELRKMLEKFGVERLTEIPPENIDEAAEYIKGLGGVL